MKRKSTLKSHKSVSRVIFFFEHWDYFLFSQQMYTSSRIEMVETKIVAKTKRAL